MNSGQPGRKDRELLEKLRNQRERIGRLHQKIEEKDREIETLKLRAAGTPSSREHVPQIFFLIGQAKSGTSWLMRTLNSHPEILCKDEGRFFGRDYMREDVLRLPSRIQPSSLYAAILTKRSDDY